MKRRFMRARGTGILVAIGCAFLQAAIAAGEARPRPAEKPLAVLKADSPAEFVRLVDALSPAFPVLSRFDAQVRLPGFAAVPDPRALMESLAAAGADGFWFGVASGGASAMGWHEPPGGEEDMASEIRARLQELGIDASRLPLRTWRHGGALAVALGAVDEFHPAQARDQGRGGEWREGFDAFMSGKDEGAGLWINARPLSGLLALASGMDLRGALASAGCKLPEAIVLTLFPSGNGFGARLVLDGVGDAGAPDEDPGDLLRGAHFGSDAFLALTVSGFNGCLSERNVGGPFPAAAIPDTFSIAFRSGEREGVEWSLAAVVGEEGREVFKRFAGALNLVAADPRTGVGLERRQAGLLEATRVALGSVAFTFALKEGADGRNYFLASSDGSLPDLARAEIVPAPEAGPAIEWTANLNALSWSGVERPVMEALNRVPGGVDPAALLALMPEGESGWLRRRGRSVEAESPGMAPLWTLPYVAEAAADFLDSLAPTSTDLAAARLRFMLDVAEQSRFRAVSPDNLSAAPRPSKPDWLDFSDPEVKAWLGATFGRFPGTRGDNWSGLRAAFSGRILDGYEYRLSPEGGWRIRAVPAPGGEDLPSLEIDAEGMVAARERDGRPARWREEPLVTALLLWR